MWIDYVEFRNVLINILSLTNVRHSLDITAVLDARLRRINISQSHSFTHVCVFMTILWSIPICDSAHYLCTIRRNRYKYTWKEFITFWHCIVHERHCDQNICFISFLNQSELWFYNKINIKRTTSNSGNFSEHLILLSYIVLLG